MRTCCPPRSTGSRSHRRCPREPCGGSGSAPHAVSARTEATSAATSRWTMSRPVCWRPSNPQWRAVTTRRSRRATGQPGRHETPVIVFRSEGPIGSTVAMGCGTDHAGATASARQARHERSARARRTARQGRHAGQETSVERRTDLVDEAFARNPPCSRGARHVLLLLPRVQRHRRRPPGRPRGDRPGRRRRGLRVRARRRDRRLRPRVRRSLQPGGIGRAARRRKVPRPRRWSPTGSHRCSAASAPSARWRSSSATR